MNRKILSLLCTTLLVTVLLPGFLVAQTKSVPAQLRVEGEGAQPLTLSAADLLKMERSEVRATDKDGKEHIYAGVALRTILEKAGAPLGGQLRGKNMTKYLLLRSRDGYEVVFSLAELDADFTDRIVLLADQQDGKSLEEGQGPFRLIVPGEKKHARWIWGVTNLFLRTAKE